MFRRCDGSELNSRGPLTQKLPSRRRWSLLVVEVGVGGAVHNRPERREVFVISWLRYFTKNYITQVQNDIES